MTRWVRRGGTLLAVIGSVVFVAYMVSALDLDSLRSHLNARSLLALIVATLLYALLVPLSAFAWKRMLAGLGHRERLFPLVAIVATSQAGKYLPGNVGHHVGRVALSAAQGIPLAIVVASMAYEICLLLLADLITAVVSGAFSGPGLGVLLRVGNGDSGVVIAVVVAVLGLAAVPLLLRFLPRLTTWLMRRRGGAHALPAPLPLRTMVEVIAIYAAAMLVVAAGLAVLSLGLAPGEPIDYPLLTAAFTLAWVVGFVTPGAPAGLGVREALLLLFLAHGMGAANASLLVLALRVATSLGDMLCFVLGLAMMHRLRAHGLAGSATALPSQPRTDHDHA